MFLKCASGKQLFTQSTVLVNWDTHPQSHNPAEASAYFITWPQAWDMNSLHTSAEHTREPTWKPLNLLPGCSVHGNGFSGACGWFRNFGPTDISWSLEVKTSVLENRQLPRTHELKTIYHHFQASCHKLYTMLLGRSNNYLAFHLFIFQKRFPKSSKQYAFILKVLQKGLGTVVYGNRADP